MNSLEYENYMETKAHADPLFPYNTYLCSIPLDFNAVPLHWHPYMEIIYIKKRKRKCNAGFHYALCRGRRYHSDTAGKDPRHLSVCLLFDGI